MRYLLLLLFSISFVNPLMADYTEDKVGWMIYPYLLKMPEDQFQRLLKSKAEYVGIQSYVGRKASEQRLTRIKQLTKAGKKIVLQIWWGSMGKFPWERYNLPNLATDPKIQEDFFTQGIDPLLKEYGPENLFAVHLLEESGMQFGFDVDIPGYPERDDDGYDNGNNYDNPANWVWGRSISGPNVLSIKKHRDWLKNETGLDMLYHPIWKSNDWFVYKNWISKKFEAGAHIAFANYIHKHYPGLKVFAFNAGSCLIPQSKVLDGQFMDPYTSTNGVFMTFRKYRLIMRPNEYLITMVWGNRQKPIDQRMGQMAASYAGGGNILSTFGDSEYKDDKMLKVVYDSVKPFINHPVFRTSPKVLIFYQGLFGASLRSVQYWITGFANYDVCPPRLAEAVKLNNYDFILGWGMSDPRLKEWVKKGGVLVQVHPQKNFLIDEAYLAKPGKLKPKEVLDYQPNQWFKENFRLKPSYKIELGQIIRSKVLKTTDVHQDQFITAVNYGKGLIVTITALCDVHAPWKYESHWEEYRQLLTDICRGALIYKGKPEVADKYFDDPKKGNDYLRVVSDDGNTVVYILLNDMHGAPTKKLGKVPEANKSKTNFVVPGFDRVSGKRDVRLCNDNPVVIIDKRK